jgi:hypothetical protein
MLDNDEDFSSLLYTVSELINADEDILLKDVFNSAQKSIQQTDYDRWNGGQYGYTVYFVIGVKTFVQHREHWSEIEMKLLTHFNLATRHLENETIDRISISPKGEPEKLQVPNPHRVFTDVESKRRETLLNYLKKISEDELIEDVLLPLFRQMGFHRITAAGHKDKALEYGKDIWMKYTLPTQHVLYFGIQAKKDKLDATGKTKAGNINVAEIHTQALMMLGHVIFDPETSKRVLVDHAFIVSAGEITKQARNWLGEKLDASQRSQILFMERDDIVNLYVVNNLPLPTSSLPSKSEEPMDDLPF